MTKINGKAKKKAGRDLTAANRVRAVVFEQRAEAVRKLLCRGHRPHEIATAVMKQYEVTERTAYKYISEARKGLRQLADGDSGQLFDQCLGILMGIVSNEESDASDRVGAVREINRMMGHHRPVTLNIGTGPDQGPLSAVNILAFLQADETTPVIGRDQVTEIVEGKILQLKEGKDNGGNGK